MSSFAGIPFTLEELGAHFLVTSANKCLQGVPGFGIIFADRERLIASRGWARSLCLDKAKTFRIGTIGHVFPHDMARLLEKIGEVTKEVGLKNQAPLKL